MAEDRPRTSRLSSPDVGGDNFGRRRCEPSAASHVRLEPTLDGDRRALAKRKGSMGHGGFLVDGIRTAADHTSLSDTSNTSNSSTPPASTGGVEGLDAQNGG